MDLAWSSVAAVSIAPLQDLLNLGREARMNVPGRAEAIGRWRCSEEMLSDPAFEWLRDLTKSSNRFPQRRRSVKAYRNLKAIAHRGQRLGTPSAV